MKLDLSCPVEVRGYSLACEDNRINAAIRLYNLAPRRVSGMEAVIKWRSNAAQKSVICPFVQENLRARGENFFEIELSTDRLPMADSLELIIKSVSFEDGTPDWRASDGPFAEIEPLPAISSERLAQLRQAAGADAVRFPAENGETWSCICGRINPQGIDECARCHRRHGEAMTFTQESVQSSFETVGETPVETLYGQFARRRRQIIRRTMLVVSAALVMTLLLIFSEPPQSIPVTAETMAVTVADNR